MNAPLILAPEDIGGSQGIIIGGKAAGLLQLSRAGLPVPPWRVIPAETAAHRVWHEAGHREAFLGCFRTLNGSGSGGVAVRSSAATEDAAEASHAGIFETCFAGDEDAFVAALDKVMDAANSERSRSYRGRDSDTRMAIIVQSAIRPDFAGVLFSADPAAALPDRCCIEAVYGYGEGLGDGTRTPSRFFVAMEPGTLLEAVSGADGPETLAPDLARALRDRLLEVEELLDAPADIEWAVAGGALWILQARPITALRAHASLLPAYCASSWFFDQRFSEPISPLTRTTLLPIILRASVQDALRMRGQRRLFKNSPSNSPLFL